MSKATPTPVREEWLTLREACDLIGVSPATLRRWSDSGDIRSFTTPGGHRRFARSAILGLLPAPVATPGGVAAAEEGEASPPPVAALVAQARHVPSAAREEFAAELAALKPSEAAIVVRTCHRVELYMAPAGLGDAAVPEPPPGAQRLEGIEAARHLAAVACGLDSAVLCENQLLHQLRRTLTRRRAEGPLDPVLDRLFQTALHTGRRARSWFDGSQRSLADVALERVDERVGSLRGRTLLIVGAGTMGRLAAVAAARQGAEVVVTSRTDERAAALAGKVGGRAVPFGADGSLPALAGAVVALGGCWPVGERDAAGLAGGEAVVVDMSSPPAVPDSLQAELGERFVSADDLAWGDGVDLQDGLRGRLEQLAAESADSYWRWLRSRNSLPAIKAIGDAADQQRRGELEWLFRRLPDLADKDRSMIEQMSHRLVAGILHAPRSALNSDDSGRLADAARELFGT